MRLASDDRARVPFAIVGVLLLVGSATLTATLHERPTPEQAEPASAVATDRATAAATTALRSAVTDAGYEASANPVVEPSETPYGEILDDETPFRDALRLRIYLAASESFEHVEHRTGEYDANVSLDRPNSPADARDAIDRVAVEPAGENETAVRVRVENVSVTVSRHDRIVDRRTETVEVVVPTPVLALHDRTERYEERLNRGPLEGPGLGRQLTGRLYAVGWARGYAQYGGAPIENVIANRHVELMTNGATLESQRAAFGTSDPAGRDAMRRGTARVGTTDLLAPTRLDEDRWADAVLAAEATAGRESAAIERPESAGSDPDDGLAIDASDAADRAFLAFVGDEPPATSDEPPSKADVLDEVYSADAELVTAIDEPSRTGPPAPSAPSPSGEHWRLVHEEIDSSVAVGAGRAPTPTVGSDWDRARVDRRVVERSGTVERAWQGPNETRTTTRTWTDQYRVGMAVAVRHAPSEHAPRNGIESIGEPGGPFGGPNLAGVEQRASDRLVADRGGPDALARDTIAANGDLSRSVTIDGEQPTELDEWVRSDLDELRTEIGTMEAEVARGELATGDANPPAELAATLRERRSELIDAPGTYGSVAEKARVAARAAYVDHTIAVLERRADAVETTGGSVEEAIDDVDGDSAGSDGRLAAIVDQHDAESTPDPKPLATSEPGGQLGVEVESSPTYLTLSSAPGSEVDGVADDRIHQPLVARNVNVFTAPYADVADGLVERLLGSDDGTDPETAAVALRAADRTAEETGNETVELRRDRLADELDLFVAELRADYREALWQSTSLSRGERQAAVGAAFDRWDGPAERTLAITNGSAAAAVSDETAARDSLTDRERELLETRLRVTAADAARDDSVRPSGSATERAASATDDARRAELESLAEDGVQNLTERAGDRWVGDRLVRTPAGLPVAPVPGYWYATLNVWHVDVGGEYGQFVVRADRGRPTGDGATIPYVRDGSAVRHDVTGDGEPETLGTASRISFSTRTTVVVVVPPGGTGVGDANGRMAESSDGWPDAGSDGPASVATNAPTLDRPAAPVASAEW